MNHRKREANPEEEQDEDKPLRARDIVPTDEKNFNPIAPPKKLAAEWNRKLKESGFRDIEYADNSLLGISMQEPSRAHPIGDYEAAEEYHSRCLEYWHARDWKGEAKKKRIWKWYADGVPMREISKEMRVPLTTLFRQIEKLRAEFEEWWMATAHERMNPPKKNGRPRREEPRNEVIFLRVTKGEAQIIRNAARRGGAMSVIQVNAWIRGSLIRAANAVRWIGPRD